MATWTVTEEGTDGTATPTTALDGPTVTPVAPTIVAFEDDVERAAFTGTAQTGAARGIDGTATTSTALDGPTVSPAAPTIVAFDDDVERAAFAGVAQTGAVRGVDGRNTPATALDGPTVSPAAPTIIAFEDEVERTAFAPSTPIGAVRGIDGRATPVTALDGDSIQPDSATIIEFDEIMRGVRLPVGSFRLVTGTVVDLEGEPIERANLLLADQWLRTSGPVDGEGNFQIRLLRTEYTDFRLLGPRERGEAPFDLVWFLGRDTRVRAGEDEDIELVFEVHEPPTGLVSGGKGTLVGGPLQS